jgi:hypothetical protein
MSQTDTTPQVTKVTRVGKGRKLNVYVNGGFTTTLRASDLSHLAGAYLTDAQLAAVPTYL